MPRFLAALLLSPCLVACMHTPESPPAFTETWYDKTQDVMAEEKARNQAKEILMGDERDAVTVRADESGRPKLQVGKDRIHADVDIKSGDPRVRLRYKLKWGHGEKTMPSSIPKLPPESKPAHGAGEEPSDAE